jgi:CRISPR-associated protein Cmr1
MPDNFRWITRKYTIEFLTPAFLGGADQSGQWRTPPLKALLRQWWRVAWAAQHGFRVDAEEMRQEEGKLFGNAWLKERAGNREETKASRSEIRLRLSTWNAGQMSQWPHYRDGVVRHPEARIPQKGSNEKSDRISSHLYLGYGPLAAAGEQARLPNGRRAIGAGEKAELALAQLMREVATADQPCIVERALWLMHAFGAAGGRSRNGWGSFRLIPADGQWPRITLPLRDWREALQLDWPHCIGKDERGALIWRTAKEYADWKELLRDLACIKIAVRTQLQFPSTREPHPTPGPRHWLAYPVTKHRVKDWGDKLRLPNSLRFKVRCVNGDSKQLIGVIYHMPCSPPPAFCPNNEDLIQVWREAHRLLDELSKPANQRRLPQTLRQAAVEQITGITLQRAEE